MNTRMRSVLIPLVVLGAAAGLYFLLQPSPQPEPAAPEPAETPSVADTTQELELQTESRPEPLTEPPTSRPPVEVAAAQESIEVDENESPAGQARIHGVIKTADDSQLPSEITVRLTRYPDTREKIATHVPFERSITVEADGNYAFKEIPYGDYTIFAVSPNKTGNTRIRVNHNYPESRRDITLAPSTVLSGVVVNTRGQLVPEASVRVVTYLYAGNEIDMDTYYIYGSETHSDVDGAFVVNTLPPQATTMQFRLLVTADGYANHHTELFQPTRNDLRLVLSSGAFASGYAVRRETGEPVSGARIVTKTNLPIYQKSGTTDPEGWFILGPLEPGNYEFETLESSLLVAPDTAAFRIVEANDANDLRIALMPGGVIIGRVYDVATDRGIANAQIEAKGPGSFQRTKTDRNGNYRVDGLQQIEYRVHYEAIKGYPQLTADEQRRVAVTLGKEYEGIDFPLERDANLPSGSISISGVVVDPSGNPVEKVRVMGTGVRQTDRVITNETADTGADGRFTLSGFVPEQKADVTVAKQGLAAPPVRGITVGKQPINDLRFVMKPQSSISGTVVDVYGKPVQSGQVQVRRTDGGAKDRSSRNVGFRQGEFEVGRLVPGTYQLIAADFQTFMSGANANHNPVSVTLGTGETVDGIQLVFSTTDPTRTVSGQVINAKNQPIPNAEISRSTNIRRAARTGPDGRFTISGLPARAVRLTAQHPSYTRTAVSVQPEETHVTMVLRESAGVSGVVVDRYSGRPIQDFELIVAFNTNSIRPDNLSGMSRYQSQDGSFSVLPMRAGSHVIAARAEGYALFKLPVKDLLPGETRPGLVLRLETANTLVGRVSNAQGQPINLVKILDGDTPSAHSDDYLLTATDNDGNFRIEDLPSGKTTITAHHNDYSAHVETITIQPGIENRVHIQLDSGGLVEGYVTAGSKPVVSQEVMASFHTPNSQIRKTQTDANGHYQIVGLPYNKPIQVIASFRTESGKNRHTSAKVTIADGMDARRDFTFTTATASIEGILTANGEPVAEGSVSLDIIGPDGARESKWLDLKSDAKGFYRLEQLPAGEARLLGLTNTRLQKTIFFTLAEGEKIQQDIHMYTGTALTCNIRNIPINTRSTEVWLLDGQIKIPARPDQAFLRNARQNALHTGTIQNGVASLERVQPGNYTLLAIARINNNDPQGPSFLYSATSKNIQLSNEEAVGVTMSF